jgi:hypothetical protein
MIENRKGKNPNTDQGRVLEVFICVQNLNFMFTVFTKVYRERKTLLFVNGTLMMS